MKKCLTLCFIVLLAPVNIFSSELVAESAVRLIFKINDFFSAVECQDFEAVQQIIEFSNLSADVSEIDIVNLKQEASGKTALIISAERGYSEILKLLIEKGADKDFQFASFKLTALMFAAEYGHIDCLKVLLGAGAKANYLDSSEMTALNYAISFNNQDCAKLLLPYTDINFQDSMGWTHIMHVILNDQDENNYVDLLLPGTNLNLVNENGDTALTLALTRGLEENAKKIIPGTNLNIANKKGRTALMLAAKLEASDCLELIIPGAALNTVDKDGLTALMYAAKTGRIDNVKLLLKKGANKSIIDLSGMTAFDYALSDEMKELF